MRKGTIFNVVASLFLIIFICFFAVHLFHLDQKADHIYRPAKLFNLHQIESEDLSKIDFPDTMSHNLNKFCYIFCQQSMDWVHKGEHSYVFETKDRRHVVKFLPLKAKPKELLSSVLSAQLSFDLLRDETGLEYLHLNRTCRTARGMSLNDFYGQQHRACGDHTRFVVQKKAELLYPTLTKLIRENRIEEAKKRIDQVIDLLNTIAEKKISEEGEMYDLGEVIGFTSNRAIYLDTWGFVRVPFLDTKSRMKFEFSNRLNNLKKWLDIVSPELAEYFRLKRDNYFTNCLSQQEECAH